MFRENYFLVKVYLYGVNIVLDYCVLFSWSYFWLERINFILLWLKKFNFFYLLLKLKKFRN